MAGRGEWEAGRLGRSGMGMGASSDRLGFREYRWEHMRFGASG